MSLKYLFAILSMFIFSAFLHAQDTIWVDSAKYLEINQGITKEYHRNGTIGKKHVKWGRYSHKTKEWDDVGNLIRKSKSGRNLLIRRYYDKSLRYEYYENGNLKRKTFRKMVGCNHVKRRWRKSYSENGKLISKE